MLAHRNYTIGRMSGTFAAFLSLAIATTGCVSDLERRFQDHINYLASDELAGRGVGTEGIEKAARYIAREFVEIGLQPAGDDGSYFQSFDMTLRRTLTDATRLTFAGDTSGRRLRKDFIPFGFSSGDSFSGDVVFCGYGIESADRDRDDFVHVDINGKVAMVLRGEPPSWANDEGFGTHHAMLRNKVYNAKDRGAVAVLIVNQKSPYGEPDTLVEFTTESADEYGVPAFHISRAMADAQLARADADTLDDFQDRLDAGRYASTALKNVHVSGQAVFDKNRAPTRNVLGLLRGDGPLSNEVVVVGAHYDHLGIRKPMMRKFKAGRLAETQTEPQIHNGADDNASGTSGLIEIARILSKEKRPRRSVLFIAFTAEESGLHGSKYFVDNPSVPIGNIVAMLNMDMIGRMNSSKRVLQIFGIASAKEFKSIVASAAASAGLSIAPSPDTGGRSDHAPFIRKEIPAMHFFSGHHGDYHKPTDDSEKINARDGAVVTCLVSQVTRDLADSDVRPTYQEVTIKTLDAKGGTPTYRVVMGLSPGYGDDGKPGMAVDAVSPDGPADLAGMKAGDRIIRIGDKKVANIYDYMAATRKNAAGDKVDVVVLRHGGEITLHVTLAPAR